MTVLLTFGLIILALAWIASLNDVRREIARLRLRIDELERPSARPPMIEPATILTPPSAPDPGPSSTPSLSGTAVERDFSPEPVAAPLPIAPSPALNATTEEPRAERPSLEQRIGGIWMQNVGSVVVLLGVLFLIVWGYTTRRLGPWVLIAAGIALGLTFIWRGDRVARTIRAFGHAMIGVGFGMIYLTIYLGRFELGVLPSAPAFATLALVSMITVAAGLRYRVLTIGVLGVIGAFLPQIIAAWLPSLGFTMSPPMLLAYLASIDIMVFAFAAAAGWSGLALAALVLTATSWVCRFHLGDWGWGVEFGLAALFLALGLGPVPWLMRRGERVRNIDLVVPAAAPLSFIAASAPFLMYAATRPVAILLLALAAAHLALAWWVDERRPERDLWRPLTGAAILYGTLALERGFGPEHTPLAWTVYGAVLAVLGARERGGWLRGWGTLIAAAGWLWTLGDLSAHVGDSGVPPFIGNMSMRVLAVVIAVLVAALLIARSRGRLTFEERYAPEAWTTAGNFLLMMWITREAALVAAEFYRPGGFFGAPVAGVAYGMRRTALQCGLIESGWMAQALALTLLGTYLPRPILRWGGSMLAAFSLLIALIGAAIGDGWAIDQLPALHLASILQALAIVFAVLGAAALASRRHTLGAGQRRLPEAWALIAAFASLMWSAREAGHLAYAIVAPTVFPGVALPGVTLTRLHTLSASLTTAAWIVEAVVLLAVGWLRGSAFLRWCGLGLLAVTLLKYVLLDLSTVDVFWRFLTAIAVGVAMLAISYAYQARARVRRAKGTDVAA